MKQTRGFLVHLGVLVVAASAAGWTWLKEDEPVARGQGDVSVWRIPDGSIQKIEYTADKRQVVLNAERDGAGVYLTGTVKKEKASPKADPHGDSEGGGGGAPTDETPTESVEMTIVAVDTAEQLLERLTNLKALRTIGQVAEADLEQFGFDAPSATVTLTTTNAPKTLIVGAPTPGGGDRYVRVGDGGEVFAIAGDTIRDLELADSRLLERKLHAWTTADIDEAVVRAGDKERRIVRAGSELKKHWADPSSPETADETVANWMTKVERLRPSAFTLEDPKAEPVFTITYKGKGKEQGRFELSRVAGDKPTYYVRSEYIRFHAEVPLTAAEPLEQDLSSILP